MTHPADNPEGGSGAGPRSRDADAGGSLRDAQHQIDEWISQFEEGYWPP